MTPFSHPVAAAIGARITLGITNDQIDRIWVEGAGDE